MASIQDDPRSGILYVNWWYGGKQYNKSTRTKDPAKAKVILRSVEDTVWKLENGLLSIPGGADPGWFIFSGGRDMGSDTIPAVQAHPLTIGEMFDQYREMLPAGAKEDNSLLTERIHANHIRRILGSDSPVVSVTLKEIQEVYARTRSQERGRRGSVRSYTVKKELKTFRLVWKWAYDTGRVKVAPPWLVKQVRFGNEEAKLRFDAWENINRKVERGHLTEQQIKELWDSMFLTGPEVSELLDYVEGQPVPRFVYPMFAFAALTGARRKEMLRSRIVDFDFDGREVSIREKKRVKDKSSTRTVEMHPRFETVMKEWLGNHPGGELTLCKDDGSVLTDNQAHHYFKATLAKHGKWSKVRGFHVLRHSFASILASEGVDQRIINAYMGHMTEEMEPRYRHLIPKKSHRPIDRLLPNG